GQTRLSISLYMSRGACLRTLARWSEATMMYKQAAWLAEHLGDTENVLNSRISLANVAMDRGNLPKAEKILDRVIVEAESGNLPGVRAIALHARGNVANLRGDYERAIALCYEALDGLQDEEARDRGLADVAASFSDLGLRAPARDAYLILAVTAQSQFTRWVAEMNLMEIAASDGEERAFEQYRRELAKAELPAKLAAHYHYLAGQGYRAFGKERLAQRTLKRAVQVASESQINEVLVKAEASLRDIPRHDAAAKPVVSKPSQQTAKVAEAIHRMRLVVNSAG
ncbi:MAG TPA: hypothetical protein VFW98_08065, partial [Gemmatimonadaceae bacterium]|nr:hypothetical protein [Gemmatimonadaceae bacterium]